MAAYALLMTLAVLLGSFIFWTSHYLQIEPAVTGDHSYSCGAVVHPRQASTPSVAFLCHDALARERHHAIGAIVLAALTVSVMGVVIIRYQMHRTRLDDNYGDRWLLAPNGPVIAAVLLLAVVSLLALVFNVL